MSRFLALLGSFLCAIYLQSGAYAGNDACQQLIPASLQKQVSKGFTGYRFIRVDDYAKEDINSEKQYHHGSECLAVASGNYYGDNLPTYAFLLISSKNELLLLVAHAIPNHPWEIVKLQDWNLGPDTTPGAKFNYYVNTIDPGSYSDEAIEEGTDPKILQAESGWVENITSKYPGIAMGVIEVATTAYFLVDGHWVHTTISD